MEQRLNRAERYRQQANRYAELAKTAEPGYLAEFFRKTAVRYVLMSHLQNCSNALNYRL
jgi:hypothetical protein